MKPPTILALDFDGVICDGLLEYFQTAWRAYTQIWFDSDLTPPSGLAESFYRLRPVVETGWEMPVVLRAVIEGFSEAEILENWPAIAQNLIKRQQLNPVILSEQVDRGRDQWIEQDLAGWLSLHRFYPGVPERVKQVMASAVQLMIITTKEGRFVRHLLQQQGIDLSAEQIVGKEAKKPKSHTLGELLARVPEAEIWFVEDRLKTLLTVQQHLDLAGVRLFLADWGYNTAAERNLVGQDPEIQLLSLEQFAQGFEQW